MFKRFLIPMLVLLALLAGAYQLRTQLLSRAFNAALAKVDLRLVEMDGLELEWREVAAKKLVLERGGVEQTLQGVQLAYSLFDARAKSLIVKRAVLSLPGVTHVSSDSNSSLRLSELLGALIPGPLDFLRVEKLELRGFPSPLFAQAENLLVTWRDSAVVLEMAVPGGILRLELADVGEAKQSLVVDFSRSSKTVLQFQASISESQGRHSIEGAGRIEVPILLDLLGPAVRLPEMIRRPSGELVFELSGAFDDDLSRLALAQWQLQLLPATNLAVQLSNDTVQGSVQLEFPEPLVFSIQAGKSLDYALELAAPVITWRLDERLLSLSGKGRLTGLRCTYPGEILCESVLGFRLNSPRSKFTGDDMWLPELAIESEVRLEGPVLSIVGSVRGGTELPLLDISAEYQLETQTGAARLLGDKLSFNARRSRLSNYFKGWPFKWDVLDGSLALDIALQWQAAEGGVELRADIKQEMTGLAVVYKEIGFVGLSGDISAQFRSAEKLFTGRSGKITLDLLDIGVPIEAIQGQFQFNYETQELALEDVQAHLFDGRVWLEDVALRAGRAHNKVFVGVDGVQLEQLLKLAGYDAVQATGTISGLLPLDVNKAGVTMKRGMLAAKAPGGVFRYTSEVSTDMNPALLPVIAALKNYHYTTFQLEADYMGNGDLEMAMQFRGSNPKVQQGRPIHLNLNISDNIPSLLRSLQSGRQIADTIGRKLGGE